MANEERQWSHQHPGGVADGRREDCPRCTPPGAEAWVHERELLHRAAAIIDPTMPTAPHEARLDWLAKYREVIS